MTERIAISIPAGPLRQEVVAALESLSIKVPEAYWLKAEPAELFSGLSRVRPAILILSVPTVPDDLASLLDRIAALEDPPQVVVVSESADPNLIMNAVRHGAGEFAYPPIAVTLKESLRRIEEACRHESENSRGGGRILGFVSAKGACGVTTLACHAATWLKQVQGKHVLLADLDWSVGITGLLMQVAPRYSLADAVQNLDRMDLTLWKAIVSVAPSGVHVIPSPAPMSEGAAGSARKLGDLFRFWRTQYDYVIVDFGRGLTQTLLGVVELVDVLALVVTGEVPALRLAKRMIEALAGRNIGQNRLKLVVNRVPKNTGMDRKTLEQIMSFPVHAELPNDYKSLLDAYSEPRLLTFEGGLGTRIAQMVAPLAGVTLPETKARRFQLFR